MCSYFYAGLRGLSFSLENEGHENDGVTEFLHEKEGGHKSNPEIIGWPQISLKILLMK